MLLWYPGYSVDLQDAIAIGYETGDLKWRNWFRYTYKGGFLYTYSFLKEKN